MATWSAKAAATTRMRIARLLLESRKAIARIATIPSRPIGNCAKAGYEPRAALGVDRGIVWSPPRTTGEAWRAASAKARGAGGLRRARIRYPPAMTDTPAPALSRSLFVFALFYGGMVCISGVLGVKQVALGPLAVEAGDLRLPAAGRAVERGRRDPRAQGGGFAGAARLRALARVDGADPDRAQAARRSGHVSARGGGLSHRRRAERADDARRADLLRHVAVPSTSPSSAP